MSQPPPECERCEHPVSDHIVIVCQGTQLTGAQVANQLRTQRGYCLCTGAVPKRSQ